MQSCTLCAGALATGLRLRLSLGAPGWGSLPGGCASQENCSARPARTAWSHLVYERPGTAEVGVSGARQQASALCAMRKPNLA
eukprot:scaffold3507_cov108-Isochrysis_galbana.AAC.1